MQPKGKNKKTNLPAIRQVRLEIHMHIHIGILDGTNRLNVIQPKTLGHLPKIRLGHRVQKPRHHPLDRPRLLLRQLVNDGRLRDSLNVEVLGGLPGAVGRALVAGVVAVVAAAVRAAFVGRAEASHGFREGGESGDGDGTMARGGRFGLGAEGAEIVAGQWHHFGKLI